jgi:hypothetical protein
VAGARKPRLPAAGVLLDGGKPLVELPQGAEVAAVVLEVVHADLAALLAQRSEDAVVHLVAQRHEVPRGGVAERPLDVAQQEQVAVPGRGLDVVGQDQCPATAVEPQVEPGDRSARERSHLGEEPLVEVVQGGLDRPPGTLAVRRTRLKACRDAICSRRGIAGRSRYRP